MKQRGGVCHAILPSFYCHQLNRDELTPSHRISLRSLIRNLEEIQLNPPQTWDDATPLYYYSPCDTNNCREISHGLTPISANSTIRRRTQSGNGRPFTKTPPNWLMPAWPETRQTQFFCFCLFQFFKSSHYYKPVSPPHQQSTLEAYIELRRAKTTPWSLIF